ncbi:hypothetical protein BZG36_05519 [Bifiguratus adelaidae]|uniref:Probable acetate kinase n=1 Tax=Bifiguratus adelaidae TaxID=1938954 RepID=A0A261XTH6_9FUNG|nr:hypothetical protein BZG36_05519 [Bifiguratus adelaidae]
MSMILVFNAGSSSLKFQLFKKGQDGLQVVAKGNCSEIGSDKPNFKCDVFDGDKSIEKINQTQQELKSHEDAFGFVVNHLSHPDTEPAAIKDKSHINIVGHRVVHGGGKFWEPTKMTNDTIQQLDDLGDLAPLHNHRSVIVIKACLAMLPDAQNYAVFDTAFHRTIPRHIYTYPVPQKEAVEYDIRKFGFHGISHGYIAKQAAKALGKPLEDLKLITLHLGNGSSICAIKGGQSIDTSMGLTPLSGLPGGTRSGDIDPSAVFHFVPKPASLDDTSHLTEAERVLNKQSGLLGLAGTSNVAEILERMDSATGDGQDSAQLAFDVFCNRIQNFLGAYIVLLEGVDAIVFSGGIGENAYQLREAVVQKLKFLGAIIDHAKNRYASTQPQGYADIGAGSIRLLVVATDEEREIAETLTSL